MGEPWPESSPSRPTRPCHGCNVARVSDHPFRPKVLDHGWVVAELRQDLLGVLPKEWWGRSNRGRGRAELERDADLAQPAEQGMVDLDGHGIGLCLGRFEGFEHAPDRAAWDLGGLEQLQPGSRRPAGELIREDRAEGVAMRHAITVRGEARVAGQLGQLKCRAEACPLALAAHGNGKLAIGRGKGLVGDDVGMGVAAANAFWAWLTRTARVASNSDRSIRWP